MNISPGETRVLFALLDAAEDLGLLRSVSAGARWPAMKGKIAGTDPEKEGTLLWELLEELERSCVLRGSWIEDRWLMIKTQVARSKALTAHPFF